MKRHFSHRRTLSIIITLLMISSMLVPFASYAEETEELGVVDFDVNAEREVVGFARDVDYQLPEYDGEDINTDSLRPSKAVATQPFYFAPGEGKATPVRDQQKYGTCWAFAMIGGMESSILNQQSTIDGGVRVGPSTLDLSELHFAFFHYNTERDPLGNFTGDLTAIGPTDNSYLTLGGSNIYSSFSLMAWKAGAREDVAPYSSITGKYHPVDQNLYYQKTAHTQNFYWVDMNNIQMVKEMIVRYGAVVIQYKHMGVFYNADTAAYYCNDAGMTFGGHAVLVVGWSDDLSRYSFNDDPGQNGAWIVKNSWGTDWGMTSPGAEGMYWMSYYDAPLRTMPGVVVDAWDGDTYDNNYQYDGTSGNNSMSIPATQADPTKIAASYEVKASDYERLDAIAAAFNSYNVNYSLQIYKKTATSSAAPDDGIPMLDTPVTGQTGLVGYYTIALNKEVVFEKGDVYSIVLSIWHSSGNVSLFVDRTDSAEYWCMFRNLCAPGQTFFAWGQNSPWADLASFVHPAYRDYTEGYNLRIKGYTNNVVPVSFKLEGGLTVEGKQDFARKNHPYAFTLVPENGASLPDSIMITDDCRVLWEGSEYTYNNTTGLVYINTLNSDIVVYATADETECTEHDYVATVTTEPTCTEAGVKTYTCSKCGDTYTEEIPALGHDFGAWQKNPDENHSEIRYCSRCDAFETRYVEGDIFLEKVGGYNVEVRNLDSTHSYTIRYATGEYTTVNGVKNGANADFTTVVFSDVKTLNLPTDGVHTVAVQDKDDNNKLVFVGTVSIDSADIESIVDYRLTDAYVTIMNLKGARRVVITDADGATVASSARFQDDGLKNYITLEVPGSGEYTVTITYNSGKIISENITVVAPDPSVTTNGRVFTLGDYAANNVQYIRVAKGEYTTAAAIKSAPDLRTYGAKYFREDTAAFAALDAVNGESTAYTAQIVFRSGYIAYKTFVITPTVPTLVVRDDTVTIGNVDNGFSYVQWIRYAPGDLDTLTKIRKTKGSRILTSEAIVDGELVITGLAPGTYSLYYLYDAYDLSEGLMHVVVD